MKGEVKMTKQYVHFEDLVTMLNEDKNMNPQTINQKIFKEISYVSLINPYKDYICLNHEEEAHRVYPSEVSFDDFKQLKMIDNFISNRLFVYIRTFEEALTANLYLILSNKMASLGDSTCSDFSVFEELLEEGENQLDMLDIYHRYENTKIIKANDKIVKKNKEVLIKFIQLGKKKYL